MIRPIGPAIRRLRESAGLTQVQVAVAAGMSPDTYSRIEQGTGNPTLASIQAVLEALGGRLEIKRAR